MKIKVKKQTIIIVAISLAIGALTSYFISKSAHQSISTSAHQHIDESANQTWTCSMHPQIRQNEPGNCPICGMDLIPLEDNQNADIDPNAISMSPTAMQLANVSTTIVGKMNLVKQVRLDGKVQADERLVYSQSSHIPGRIEKLLVNFTGEFVNKGQIIANVYSPELVTAQEELFEAQKIAESQPQLFAAAKEKLKNWKLSDKQIDEILTSGKIREEFPIQADIAGYVTSKMINLGDYVRQGETIYEIADLSKVWVLFDVYESDMSWIKKGDKVNFTIASLPGELFIGNITWLDQVIDLKTRVAKARIEYSNANGKLKPEMFASGTVEAKLANKSNALVVPKTAVMWTGKRSVVYVKSSTERGVYFIMREVTLGPSLGESFVVENSLMEGEEIAVNGTFSIDAAAQLAGKPSMMSQKGGLTMTGHNHGGDNIPTITNQNSHSKSITISSKAKEELKPLFNSYFELKDALVNDNLENALKYSKEMNTVLSKINMGIFTGKAHNVWMKYSSTLEKELRKANSANKIEKMRVLFKNISDQMVMLIKTFGAIDQPVFVNYCPMANNKKGADWLSTEKEIKNPYFGASMLKCGKVKQEIK